MERPTPETLFFTADRSSSELLWAVTQLSSQPLPEPLRERAAEMLGIVISGLQLNQQQLTHSTKDTHS